MVKYVLKLVKGIHFMIVLLFLVEHGTIRQHQEKMYQIWVYEDERDETYFTHADVKLLFAASHQFIQWDSQQKGEKWNIYNCKFCVIKLTTTWEKLWEILIRIKASSSSSDEKKFLPLVSDSLLFKLLSYPLSTYFWCREI